MLGGMSLSTGAMAQGVTFCLRDGMQIKADRFENRDGKFYLYIGTSSPLEHPASAVVGINVTCPTPSVAAPAVTAAAANIGQTRAAVGAPAASGGEFAIHGSNTIGERLMPMLVDAFAEKQLRTKPAVKMGAPEEQEITLRPTQGGAPTVVQLHAHGSGTSAKGLASGAAVIGMSSRRATDPEVKSIEETRRVNILAAGNEHVLALDGLAVIVHPSNPVIQLSLDQIAAIFSGQVTNWSQLGGRDATIAVHRRDDKSGTYDTFNSLVLSPRKVKPTPQAKAYESSESLSEEVFKDQNAIGFIGLPYINRNKALQITQACGLASAPTKFGVKTETYPLARRLYLYTLGQPNHPVARNLLTFSLSDEAQATVTEAGFVEQSVEVQSDAEQVRWADSFAAAPDGYLPGKEIPQAGKSTFMRVLGASRRTSLVLRFDRASANLDTRAKQDIQRFARFLSSPAARGKRFWVVGFADADGNWSNNLRLSQGRATSVARALRSAGIAIANDQLLPLSYQAPVACNDTDAGKANNRRVEIWLTR
jgi:phosphate transport system substrate-binding protein